MAGLTKPLHQLTIVLLLALWRGCAAARCVQLLDLDMATVRALVLRQPSLLARTTEGLQSKVDAYVELFGQEHLGQVKPETCKCSMSPQLLLYSAGDVPREQPLVPALPCRLAWYQPLNQFCACVSKPVI